MTRDEQIKALAAAMQAAWTDSEEYNTEAVADALLDGPVAVMIAEAERRGAVKALRDVTRATFSTVDGRYGVDKWLNERADAIEAGKPS